MLQVPRTPGHYDPFEMKGTIRNKLMNLSSTPIQNNGTMENSSEDGPTKNGSCTYINFKPRKTSKLASTP